MMSNGEDKTRGLEIMIEDLKKKQLYVAEEITKELNLWSEKGALEIDQTAYLAALFTLNREIAMSLGGLSELIARERKIVSV